MKYDPSKEKCPLPHSIFRACVTPRPIAWISTTDENGIDNLAPFSQCQIVTIDPPMVMFCANHYPDDTRKDSARNAESTGWFVWNMATEDLKEAVNKSAMIVPSHVDEFELANVAKIKADLSQIPMVADSPCQLECKYISTQTIKGNSNLGTVDLILGEVIRIHVKDEYIKDGMMDVSKAQVLARMGYIDYSTISNSFSMQVPMAPELLNIIMCGSD
ncbi:flavin reductase family protein [Erwinia endophytica]|uniref:flavin reductase family protein n=1 Tax=Erwinia endophytica TaxID=1563158 RepID=UPI001265E0B2|nr:flavin reductase family protein [Erwinia endophytica]KAB8312653.1 flavin reductase family protein [Erwinia endophytica]